MIRWILGKSAGSDCHLTVGDVSSLKSGSVSAVTYCPVPVCGGALVEAMAMSAAALEPGQSYGGAAVPRTRKCPATPETIWAEVAGGYPAKVEQESAEVGPRGGGIKVHIVESVPPTCLRCQVGVPE